LFPAWSGQLSVSAPIIRRLVVYHEPMERQLAAAAPRAAAPAEPAPPPQSRTFKNLEGRTFTQQNPAAQAGQDSLSMIAGGHEYFEEAKAAAREAEKQAAQAQVASRTDGQGGSLENPCSAIAGRSKSIQWVSIPGGTFIMGSDNAGEAPRRRVAVRPFQMAKTEVTYGQYCACVSAGACAPPGREASKLLSAEQPVVDVDWSQAQAFSKWVGGRLPSEAEWEYAARSAGKDWEYPWGNEHATCDRAVIEGCSERGTLPVCSKPRGNTAQGTCDMAGNVGEWVQDWYHDSYSGAPADGSAWESPAGSSRVLRGGTWHDDAAFARSASRHRYDPALRAYGLGFRPARGG
jgi:formylglycine-generating enzyme required for sulfatase activity